MENKTNQMFFIPVRQKCTSAYAYLELVKQAYSTHKINQLHLHFYTQIHKHDKIHHTITIFYFVNTEKGCTFAPLISINIIKN